jgi:AcrR family transcriptional regulator
MARVRLTRVESQQQTRQHLLDAAEDLFRRQGLHRTTVGQIADKAGYTAGALYSNFANKEELALAVLARSTTQGFQKLGATMGTISGLEDRLIAVIDWRRRLLADNEPLSVLRLELSLHARRDETLRAHLGDAQRELRASFTTLIKRQAHELGATLTVEPDVLSAALLSIADGTAIASAVEPDALYAEAFAWTLANVVRTMDPVPIADADWDGFVERLTKAARSRRVPARRGRRTR